MQRKSGYKIRFCAAFTAIVFVCTLPDYAGSISDSNKFASEITANTFYDLALQIVSTEGASQTKAEQAIIFLKATLRLDNKALYITPDLVKLMSRFSSGNQTQLVRQLLTEYLKKPTDFVVIRNSLSYLLDNADSREEREKVIQDLYSKMRNKNNKLDSELFTMLGLLRLEVADANAVSYFDSAYAADKYNRLAYNELLTLAGNKVNALTHLEHLRLMLGENPLDLDSALSFADYLRNLELYQTASDAYRYCSDLYGYLYPNNPLPAEIYLPWSISDLNTPAVCRNA